MRSLRRPVFHRGARGFEAAVERARPTLIRVAIAMVGENDAEDVVQEAILKAWRLTRRPPRNWESWLFRCTQNVARNYLSARKRVPPTDSLDELLEDE